MKVHIYKWANTLRFNVIEDQNIDSPQSPVCQQPQKIPTVVIILG